MRNVFMKIWNCEIVKSSEYCLPAGGILHNGGIYPFSVGNMDSITDRKKNVKCEKAIFWHFPKIFLHNRMENNGTNLSKHWIVISYAPFCSCEHLLARMDNRARLSHNSSACQGMPLKPRLKESSTSSHIGTRWNDSKRGKNVEIPKKLLISVR